MISKQEALMYMEEAIFINSQYITGILPTTMDKCMFELLKYNLYENMELMDQKPIEIQPSDHPRTFAWCNLIDQFSDVVLKSWQDQKDVKDIDKIVYSLINSLT
jgi:hypothetical protein